MTLSHAQAITFDGQYLAYSCSTTVRIFAVSRAGKTVSLDRVKKLPKDIEPAQKMFFTADKTKLVMATMNHRLQVLDLGSLQVKSSDSLLSADAMPGPCILALSSDGSRAAITNDASIYVYDTASLDLVLKVPLLESQPTTFAFMPGTSVLVIACVDNTVFMFDTASNTFTPWSQEHSDKLPHQWLRRRDKVTGITFDPALPESVILYTHGQLCVIHMDKAMPDQRFNFNNTTRGIKRKPASASTTVVESKASATAPAASSEAAKVSPNCGNCCAVLRLACSGGHRSHNVLMY